MTHTKNNLQRKNNQYTNTQAFTLVELIVVIVILAILATIAFLSFSSQSWSARDSTRLSDISSIKKSVEMYNVNAWTYPTPDYAYSYTYSWGIIWNQWTIWDSAYKMLQKNLSKKVTDPLKWSEYDYSLASNKREYQVAWNFENPTSLERNYNPFDSSNLSPQLSALWWTGANVYISWNYNWVMLKVFTWSTYYFIPTPTLFWIWIWSTVYDNTFWSWKDLLPWVNNAAVFDSTKVYATNSTSWMTTDDVNNLMVTIQAAYLTWNVTTPAVQAIVAATWAALTDLWTGLAKSAGVIVLSSSGSGSWTPASLLGNWTTPAYAWMNCNTIKNSFPSSADWVYWINPTQAQPVQAYCDMSSQWGWWTLCANANEVSAVFTWAIRTTIDKNMEFCNAVQSWTGASRLVKINNSTTLPLFTYSSGLRYINASWAILDRNLVISSPPWGTSSSVWLASHIPYSLIWTANHWSWCDWSTAMVLTMTDSPSAWIWIFPGIQAYQENCRSDVNWKDNNINWQVYTR